MARWPIPPNLHSEIGGGPPCFFADHSLGSRDGRVPRYSDSHACVRCIAALTEGRLSLDVHKIHKKHRRRFLEFWSLVELGEPDECWSWHGAMHSRANTTSFPIPRHWGSGRQYAAPRVATWFTWGDIGRLPIKHLCGNNNCCNPSHIRIQGVPHFYHNRQLQLLDLEFNAHRLQAVTQQFLETTRQRDPQRFAHLERTSRVWLEFRLARGGPVDAEAVAAALQDLEAGDDDDEPLDPLDRDEPGGSRSGQVS
jgi:hypothetical protein